MKRQSTGSTIHRRGVGAIELLRRPSTPLTELTQVELKEFSSYIKANWFTFERYAGMRQLRLWEALALHHFLDPGGLFLNRSGRLEELKQVMWDLEDHDAQHRLVNFVFALQQAVKDAHAGKLQCIRDPGDLMRSFVALDQLEPYIREHGTMGGSESLLVRAPERKGEPEHPKFIRDLLAAWKLWHKFDPADRATHPDVATFLQDKGYNNRLSTAMATLCRPANAPKGRPPKAGGRSWSESSARKSVKHF